MRREGGTLLGARSVFQFEFFSFSSGSIELSISPLSGYYLHYTGFFPRLATQHKVMLYSRIGSPAIDAENPTPTHKCVYVKKCEQAFQIAAGKLEGL